MVASQQPGVYVCIFVTFIPAAVVLGLRFYARRMTRIPLWFDDYLAVASFVAALGYDISIFFFLHYGLGKHLDDLPITEEQARYYEAMCQEIEEHTYTFAIGFAQLSLLALFWRIFKADEGAALAIAVLTAAATCWTVIRLFIGVFQCYPPQYLWDKTIDGNCTINPGSFFIGSVASHLAIDIALMILPATQIWKLRLPIAQKIAIAAMFTFGGVVCVASIIMIIESSRYDASAKDIMWNTTSTAEWSAVEIHLSIITCCLPILRPVLQVVGSWFSVKLSSNQSQSHQAGSRSIHDRPSQQRPPPPPQRRRRYLQSLTFGTVLGNDSSETASTHQLADLNGLSFGQPPGHEPLVVKATTGGDNAKERGAVAEDAIKVKYEVNMEFSKRYPE